jgi:DNA replication and repair protein RecF
MAGVLSDYDRVLKQRTALLKSARARGIRGEGLSTLDVWDDKLVQLGTDVIRARLALVDDLAGPVARAYTAIAGADHRPEMEWMLSIGGLDPTMTTSRPSTARHRPARTRRRGHPAHLPRAARRGARIELERGLTLVGPHRDDLLLRVRGLPVKGYASHGESWSVALALRLASAELLRAQSQLGDPVLILDDVFAELDADRRSRWRPRRGLRAGGRHGRRRGGCARRAARADGARGRGNDRGRRRGRGCEGRR